MCLMLALWTGRLSYIRDHDMLESCSFNVIAAMPRLEVQSIPELLMRILHAGSYRCIAGASFSVLMCASIPAAWRRAADSTHHMLTQQGW